MRRLRARIINRAFRLNMPIEEEKPRERIVASKSVFVLYLEYLQTRMLEHADTSRKRSGHLKFLTREHTRNFEIDEVADVYRQSLASLYKTDAAWRKSVIVSLESTLPDDDYDDGGWGHGRLVFANDVLPYTGVLEAAGADPSKIFEKHHKESATSMHGILFASKSMTRQGALDQAAASSLAKRREKRMMTIGISLACGLWCGVTCTAYRPQASG